MMQEEEVLFREVQSFRGKFHLTHVFTGIALVGALFAVTVAILQNPERTVGSIVGMAGGMVVLVGLAVLFMSLKLETEVCSDGLYVRYFPFHLKYRKIEFRLMFRSPKKEFSSFQCSIKGDLRSYSVIEF